MPSCRYRTGRANASNFMSLKKLLFWLFRNILQDDCLCWPQAGGLRSGLTTAFSPFSGAPSPQKITPDGVTGLVNNDGMVRLGTGGECPLLYALNFVFFKKII